MTNETDIERDANGDRIVTTDALAQAGAEFRAEFTREGTPASRRAAMSWRNLLIKRALRQGMHVWTVANYAGISERYARGMVKASDRGTAVQA